VDRHEPGTVAVGRIRIVADISRRDPNEVPLVGHGLQYRASRVLIRGDINHHSVRLGPIVARWDEDIEGPAAQVEIVVHHLGPSAVHHRGVLQGAQGDVALEAGSDRRRSCQQRATGEACGKSGE